MQVPVGFHQVNDWLCFVAGYITNGALLWLIAYRTEKEGRNYSPILLLSTLVDLVHLAVYAIVTPVMLVTSGFIVLISVGPLGQLPHPYNFALIGVSTFTMHFSLWSQCVPFVYRYAKICCEKKWGLREFLALLVAPTAASLGMVGMCYYAGYPGSEAEQRRAREQFPRHHNNEYLNINSSSSMHNATSPCCDLTPFVVSYFPRDKEHSDRAAIYAVSLVAVNYLLVFTCGWRIYCHLKKQTATNLSAERARQLNKQVSRALLLQALIPLFAQSVPSLLMGILAMSGLQVGDYSVHETALLAWTPVVNPLISMWVVHSYRQECKNWLTCGWYKGAAVGAVLNAAPVLTINGYQQQQRSSLQPTIAIKSSIAGQSPRENRNNPHHQAYEEENRKETRV